MKESRIPNAAVITKLKEALAAMEIKNYNWFKIRAYQNAISVLENLTSSIQDIWEEGRLDDIPGIGEGLTDHLNDLFSKGVVPEWENLKLGLPDGMFALLGLRGIGAKKAYKLAKAFKLENRTTALEKIKIHADKHEIQELEGFGEKSEKDIIDAINDHKKTKNEKQRMLLVKAEEIIERLITYMKENPNVVKIDALGSYRRRSPTVGDLDLVVATDKPEDVLEHFSKFGEVAEILVKGDRKCAVVLSNDVQVDLNVSKPSSYGAMLQYNTGSKQHNIILRTYALDKKLSLSEYGIKTDGHIEEFSNELDFYKYIGLPYIEPELRQGADELELARYGKLPKLVTEQDIKGDLHMHTVFSDGVTTMEQMVQASIARGYKYVGISDHSPSVTSRGPREVERLIQEQRALVDKINSKQNHIQVFLGMEVNIAVDSDMALPDEYLKMLDYAIASIHTGFTQPKNIMTERLVKAIENPYITMIGHPSGRLINERDAIDVDWTKVFDAVIANGKFLEINSQPNRLDLADDLVKVAQRKGIKLLINTDSHAPEQLNSIKYGIDVARRGFCEVKSILNTLPLADFAKAFLRIEK
jgi:DNA polymerase (family X)